ncbi:MAG: hypothetical protein A3F68_09975 [Acidobacteria bacterium RIFCSPLOWO2_12_FULL_54_10]|nr:MAG: hypothetical protein A3F68_09975 [Acidobacteria bacterium RIFCSPLOWO2_12_FULL_54_10]
MYTPRILKSAIRQLERIDPPVARRIADRIRWLAAHFEEIMPEPPHKEKLIIVHAIGHRKEIYKKPKL